MPADGNTLSALPGEAGIPSVASPSNGSIPRKGMLALVILSASLVTAGAVVIQRSSATTPPAEPEATRTGDKPSAATLEPRKLDIAKLAPIHAASAPPRIPALEGDSDEAEQAIAVRRTSGGATPRSATKHVAPEDAPVLLVSARPAGRTAATGTTRASADDSTADPGAQDRETSPTDPLAATARNLETYQRQLQGLLNDLTRTADLTGATASTPNPAGPLLSGTPAINPVSVNSQPQAGGLFGGQLQGSTTPAVSARVLSHRSLTLPKGTAFTCALKTRLISAASGLVGCQVQRNVYSEDGRVLLIERGSHLDGEYRMSSARPGMVRIPVLWTRIRTPLGVTVDIDSPATGPLGESGVQGYVDNRWPERIGAAMLLSLIDDSVKLVIQNQTNDRQGDTILMPSTTANTSRLAEKVLDSTINIPPLVYQNQGGIVGIYVARDVDFSSVYELRPSKQ